VCIDDALELQREVEGVSEFVGFGSYASNNMRSTYVQSYSYNDDDAASYAATDYSSMGAVASEAEIGVIDAIATEHQHEMGGDHGDGTGLAKQLAAKGLLTPEGIKGAIGASSEGVAGGGKVGGEQRRGLVEGRRGEGRRLGDSSIGHYICECLPGYVASPTNANSCVTGDEFDMMVQAAIQRMDPTDGSSYDASTGSYLGSYPVDDVLPAATAALPTALLPTVAGNVMATLSTSLAGSARQEDVYAHVDPPGNSTAVITTAGVGCGMLVLAVALALGVSRRRQLASASLPVLLAPAPARAAAAVTAAFAGAGEVRSAIHLPSFGEEAGPCSRV
jgi:hypothetical protein